jgi:protein TonB
MFAESLLESGVTRRTGRGWATTASFSMQLLAIAALVALPSVYPEMLAIHHMPPVSIPIFSPPPPPTEAQPVPQQSSSGTSPVIPIINVTDSGLKYRSKTQEQADPGPAPQPYGLNPSGHGPAIPGNGYFVPPIPKPPVHAEPLRLSHMDPGSLTRSVPPAYPQIAKVAGIQGQVVLSAIISKTGEIESLQAVSGHPMLTRAAVEAVRQWRYRPYILNGEPIEVETQITVNFKLGN